MLINGTFLLDLWGLGVGSWCGVWGVMGGRGVGWGPGERVGGPGRGLGGRGVGGAVQVGLDPRFDVDIKAFGLCVDVQVIAG